MTHSDQLDQLATAMALAQSEIEGAAKTSANPFFHSKYADLASVWDACRKPLTDHGLSIIQAPFATAEGIGVETMVLHVSGQWIASMILADPKDRGPQSVISVTTYLRRVGLSSMVGVPQIDDDAEAATDHTPSQPSQPTTTKTAEVAGGLRVTGVTEKSGTSKAGKPYIAYTVSFSDGRKASTFDALIKDAATSFWKNNTPCEAVLTEKNGYYNIVELNIVRELTDPALGF